MENWEDRSKIVANLLNPAFCGEILRRAIVSYNDNEENMLFPFSLLYLICEKRQKMFARKDKY